MKKRTAWRRKSSVQATKSNKFVAADHSYGKVRMMRPSPMTRTLAMMSLTPQWYTCQGLSRIDTSFGFQALGSRVNTTTQTRILPAHIYDLTALPQGVTGVDIGFALTQVPTPLACGIQALLSQAPNGGVATTAALRLENVAPNNPQPHRKSFHEYTEIRLNLYGVRKRSTQYDVSLVMIKDEFADFINAADTNVHKHKVYDYLVRPYMFNNLNSGDIQTRADIKVLKNYRVTIGPISIDEGTFGVTNTPKIHTLKWFIRHNRVRKYDWLRTDVPLLDDEASWDQETAALQTRTKPETRVYLLIRAVCPEETVSATISAALPPDPTYEPSYDFVIKQKHLFSV